MTQPGPGESPQLTYSEEFILRAIREGRRDPEIAVSLGIAVGDVKARIERLSRMAAVESRDALGRWDPAAHVEPAPDEIAVEALPPARGRAIPWSGLLGGFVTLAIAAVAIWIFARDSSSGESSAPQATPDVAVFDATGTLPVEPLRFVAATDFPADLLLYVLRGCETCAAPISLDRVYRDQFGEVRSEAMFRIPAASGRYILSVWSGRDASDIVIAACDQGSCGGERRFTSDAATRFDRSRDGGVSWHDIGAVAGRARTVTGSSGKLVLVRSEFEGILTFHVLGGDGSEDASQMIPPGPPAEFALIQRLDAETAQGLSKIAVSVSGAFAYTWYPYSPAPDTDGVATRLGLADRFGNSTKMLEYVGAPLTLGVWLDATTVVGTVPQSPGVTLPGVEAPPRSDLPVLIDLVRETISSLPDPFTNTRYIAATSEVVAAVRGEFTRVGSSAGPCLTLMRFPRRDAPEAACLPAGVLVTIADSRLLVSEEWLLVQDPSQRTGWVRPEDADALLKP